MIDQVLQKKMTFKQYKEFSIDIFEIVNEKYLDLCIKYLNDESVPISARYLLNYLLFSIEGLKALRYTSHQKFTVDEMVHYFYELTGEKNFINYLNDIKYLAKEIFILNLCRRLKSNKISQSNHPSIIFIFGNRGSGKTTFIYYALESIANSISELDIPTLSPPIKIPSYLIDEIPKNIGNYGAIYINLDVFSRLDPIYLATRVFGYYFTMETVFSHARALTEYVRNEAIKENLNIIDDSSRCSDNRMQELCAPPKGYKQYNFMIVSDRNTAILQASERIEILGRDNDLDGISESALFANQRLLPFVLQKLQSTPTFIFVPINEVDVSYKFKLVASNRLFVSHSNYIFVPNIECINNTKIVVHDKLIRKFLKKDDYTII